MSLFGSSLWFASQLAIVGPQRGFMQRRRLKIYFDGGCQPNPGMMELAVVAHGIAYFLDDVGCGTEDKICVACASASLIDAVSSKRMVPVEPVETTSHPFAASAAAMRVAV
jgi:hypothetical protein